MNPIATERLVIRNWRAGDEDVFHRINSDRGQGYASEAAQALLADGFDRLKLSEIVAFAVEANAPSIAVMKRIGMTADPKRDFDHPRVPATHPEFVRHVVYRMTASGWAELQGAA